MCMYATETLSRDCIIMLTVGVTHEPMASAWRKGMLGTRAQTSKDVASHIATMIGPRRMERGRHCFLRYREGS